MRQSSTKKISVLYSSYYQQNIFAPKHFLFNKTINIYMQMLELYIQYVSSVWNIGPVLLAEIFKIIVWILSYFRILFGSLFFVTNI